MVFHDGKHCHGLVYTNSQPVSSQKLQQELLADLQARIADATRLEGFLAGHFRRELCKAEK